MLGSSRPILVGSAFVDALSSDGSELFPMRLTCTPPDDGYPRNVPGCTGLGHSPRRTERASRPAALRSPQRDGPSVLIVRREQMTEFFSLDLQVALVLNGRACDQWNALFDHYGRRFHCRHLVRVVGEQANSAYSELE
jgi:hypothetical protein